MSEEVSNHIPLPPANQRWSPIVWLSVVFVCGAIVGGVGASFLTRSHLLTILQHPEKLPDRVLPHIRSKLSLVDEQAAVVEQIVRKRYKNMELLRAEIYPRQREELSAMQNEVAQHLNETQRSDWSAICQMVEKRYLPTKPMGPPIDLIFFRFDSNDDGVLTQDEIPPRMWLRVRLADQNGDGKVTREEFQTAAAEHS